MTSYTVHYQSESFNENEESPERPKTLHELVHTGQMLVTKLSEKGSEGETDSSSTVLDAGENTVLNNKGQEIVAAIDGYPQLSERSTGKETRVRVQVLPLVSISVNKMEARLNLFPPLSGQELVDTEQIVHILQSTFSVKQGIDYQAIEDARASVQTTGEPVLDRTIARGKPAIDGEDAYLRMEVEIGPLPGTILADGSIDFRERKMFVPVWEGQLLATKIIPRKGEPGYSLLGTILPAKDGKDITAKIAGDTAYDDYSRTVYATASGVLCVVNRDTLRVSTQQKIKGDVSFHTGNVRSHSGVEITGSVLPGFTVSVQGNLLIGGSVESAEVKCRGNIDIKGGIVGKECTVESRGGVDAKYVERASITADGPVVIRTGSYYSSILAGGDIHCPETVKLIGGVISAGGSMTVGQIGSDSASPTHIAVGVDPRRFQFYLDLKQRYKDILRESEEMVTRYGREALRTNNDLRNLEETLCSIQKDLTRLNLIPGSPKNSLGEEGSFLTKASVTVHHSITAGTIVRIGNDSIVILNDLKKCTIRQDEYSGAILSYS